jgi:hypothetical protein
MDRYRIAGTYRLLGDVRASIGNRNGAESAWSAGLGQLPRDVTERPWELGERAQLVARVGRTDEARSLADRLAAMRYRVIS